MVALILCIGLAVAVFYYISGPLLRGVAEEADLTLPVGEDWRMNTALQQLREIDLDLHSGKLSEEDHRNLKRLYETRAAEYMRPTPTSKKGSS